MEWRRHRRVVEERAVLGYWRRVVTSFCSISGSAEGVGWCGHELHCHVEGRRRRKFWGVVCVEVDNPFDTTHHLADHQHRRCCGWNFRCSQQWLPIMGSSLWEAFLRILGNCPLVSIPEGSHGTAEQNSYHCYRVVYSSGVDLLSVVGENRSFLGKDEWTRPDAVWYQLLTGVLRLAILFKL